MLAPCEISLAVRPDAAAIAALSRDCIEQGLRWSWTVQRVRRCIDDRDTNVAVIRDGGVIAGFAIMKYGDDEGQLFLLAVRPSHRRRGFGTALLSWLAITARTAGIKVIRLQVRSTNDAAIAFYRSVGFRATAVHAAYYQGAEDALLMSWDLTAAR
jgi:[ribosomal protein S18]-alanine N-acetyltransferase